MPSGKGEPQGVKLLTNVAIVRLKRGGAKVEIACYPNKVEAWRRGLEKDLDEVLQADGVFTNVEQGVRASKKVLQKAFKTSDADEVIRIVLKEGEIQISGLERDQAGEAKFKEIATIIAEKCVDSTTNRAIPVSQIERAMKAIHYNVVPKQNAKQQALRLIAALQSELPIERAKMGVRVSVAAANATDELAEALGKLSVEATPDEYGGEGAAAAWYCVIDSSRYRDIGALVQPANGTIEVVDPAIREDGTEDTR